MKGRWQVLPHPTGHWVINTGDRRLALPEVPARWLLPLNGRRPGVDNVLDCLRRGNRQDKANWSEYDIQQAAVSLTDGTKISPARQTRRALWLRLPLLSPNGTRLLARRVEAFTGGRILAALAVLGAVGPLILAEGNKISPLSGGDWLPALALFFTGALLHELGHAAALSAQGYPAGGIGAGLLFVIPVLYNDVSAISLLPRSGKLRVDLAGVVLQAAYGSLIIIVAGSVGSPWPAGILAAKMTYLAVGWSLIPFIRADGYWALCDFFGFTDLDQALVEPVSTSRMLFHLVHRVLNMVFLVFVAVVLPLTWSGRLTAILPVVVRPMSSFVFPGLIILIWWVMARRIRVLLSAFVSDLRLWKSDPMR
jgi:hypothetical protein